MKEAFVLENERQEINRFVSWTGEKVNVVRDNHTKRILLVSDIRELEEQEIDFEVLDEVTKAQVRKGPYKIGPHMRLKLFSADDRLLSEVPTKGDDESEERLKTIFAYALTGYVALIAVIILSAYIINKFMEEPQEATIVQVFRQDRQIVDSEKLTVAPSKKIKKQVKQKARVANRTRTVRARPNAKVVKVANRTNKGRAGLSSSQKAAVNTLTILGGFSKSFGNGSGVNLNAKSSNAGIGNGGSAARGGHERGLVGKGMVASGVGSGGQLKGFGGSSAQGLGGGKAGYGTVNRAGHAGAYFEPLTEESLIEGGLDQDQINAVIRRNIGQVTYCYEQGLQQKPNLSGRVAVKFVINGSGRVNGANISSTSLKSGEVEGCILNRLKGWKFPAPVGGVNVRVTYPFQLKRLSQG